MKKVVLQLWIGLEVEDEIADDIVEVRKLIDLRDRRSMILPFGEATELACSLNQNNQLVGEAWVWF